MSREETAASKDVSDSHALARSRIRDNVQQASGSDENLEDYVTISLSVSVMMIVLLQYVLIENPHLISVWLVAPYETTLCWLDQIRQGIRVCLRN
jgi:hypothetical protein